MLDKKKSNIDGTGIFTDQPIAKGTPYHQIAMNKCSSIPYPKWARIGDRYVCDEKVLNFVNHSCNPNTEIDADALTLVAIKKIAPNDEITVDYNKTEIAGEHVPCHCQSQNCRGTFKREA